MQIEIGTRVVSRDGKDVGHIDRLLLDRNGEVESVVVRKGALLPHDVAIPRESLEPVAEGRVRINFDAGELDALPNFDEDLYTGRATVDPAAPVETPAIGYAAPRMGYSASYGQPPPPTDTSGLPVSSEERSTIAEALTKHHLERAVIGAGSDVRSRDGEKVGEVERLAFDEDGRLTHLVIKHGGFFGGEKIEVPAARIASIDDRLIVLDADAAELKRDT